MSMALPARKSLEDGLDCLPMPSADGEEFFEDMTEEAKLKKRLSCGFKPKYVPVADQYISEKTESDITSLDSDEEECHLISTNDVKDMHFKCHNEHASDYRQQKIDEYLSFKMKNYIPSGINSLDVKILTDIHLFLYHRLPSPEALATIKKPSLA